jgi:hypothetical protein
MPLRREARPGGINDVFEASLPRRRKPERYPDLLLRKLDRNPGTGHNLYHHAGTGTRFARADIPA